MKQLYKSILFVATIIVATMLNWSCDTNDSSSGGTPYILYVRVTNPASADSLLVSAGQGQLIAIVGGNLQNTREVWFNDQKATFNPVYITNTTVLVNVPTQIPGDVNNKLKLIFANKDSLLYDFNVKINKPTVSAMDNEYALDGETTVIRGQYFYFPVTVTFQGGGTVTSDDGGVTVNATNTAITLKVPEGAQPGQITVATNFGTTKSDFMFRDDRNIFEGFDDPTGAGNNITDPGDGDPPLINGPYSRLINPAMGSWVWTELFSWVINHNIPDDAILNPGDYNYKFEVNTVNPYNANGVRIWVSSQDSNTNGSFYSWNPPLDTQGKWQTVVIPLGDIMSANVPIGVLPNYFFSFVFCGDGTLNCDMCFDNFRIVPKVIQDI